MAATPLDLVQAFCDSWATGDLDTIMSFFADDAVYHNIPVDPVRGADAIRATIAGFTAGVESVVFEMKHIAAADDVVLTERLDVFTFPSGQVALPVAGTFEVRDGRIVAWRDYFDMNQFVSQLPTGGG
jgi:limonene-1,2-epoxide hydrolase